MATGNVTLDTTQYVQITSASGSFILQSHRDAVRIAFSNAQPAKGNQAFHILGSTVETVLNTGHTEELIWALAMTEESKLTVTRLASTESRITDRQGRSVRVSQKGELITGSAVDDVDINFQYTIRTAETVSTTTGTGSISHPGTGGSYAELSPGTGVGSAQLISRAPVRYRGGHEVYSEMSTIFRTPEANLNQMFGFINDNDRLTIGFQGLGFGIFYREGGNDTFVEQADFNIDKIDGSGPSRFTIDPQKINVSQCAFVWHGGLPLTIQLQIGQQWFPVHMFDFSNTIDETHLENPHLPIGGLIERTSGAGTDESMKSGSWRGGSIASAVDEPSDDWTSWTTLDVSLVSSARTNIMTIINPATWQGKQNHIAYELGVIAFSSSANKDVAVYGTKGATLTGAAAAAFIDEANYAIQYQEGGTVTGGSRGPATILKSGGERRTDTRDTGIKVFPGEAFTIEVDAGGAVNGSFSISTRWIHEG